jgi:hypothetical protein
MKTIKHITELTFMRGETPGMMYDVLTKETPEWEDADEVLITIPPTGPNLPDLLKTIVSIQKDTTIFVPCQPMTCTVENKDGKRLIKCDL